MWGFERWWLRTLRYLGGLLLNLAGPAQPSPNHAPSPSSDSQAPLFWRPPHKPTWWNPGSSSITQAPQRLIPWPLLSGRQSQLRSQDCLCRGFWSQGTQTGLRVCGDSYGETVGAAERSLGRTPLLSSGLTTASGPCPVPIPFHLSVVGEVRSTHHFKNNFSLSCAIHFTVLFPTLFHLHFFVLLSSPAHCSNSRLHRCVASPWVCPPSVSSCLLNLCTPGSSSPFKVKRFHNEFIWLFYISALLTLSWLLMILYIHIYIYIYIYIYIHTT